MSLNHVLITSLVSMIIIERNLNAIQQILDKITTENIIEYVSRFLLQNVCE